MIIRKERNTKSSTCSVYVNWDFFASKVFVGNELLGMAFGMLTWEAEWSPLMNHSLKSTRLLNKTSQATNEEQLFGIDSNGVIPCSIKSLVTSGLWSTSWAFARTVRGCASTVQYAQRTLSSTLFPQHCSAQCSHLDTIGPHWIDRDDLHVCGNVAISYGS